MGEAKKRGTFEERKKLAIDSEYKPEKAVSWALGIVAGLLIGSACVYGAYSLFQYYSAGQYILALSLVH